MIKVFYIPICLGCLFMQHLNAQTLKKVQKATSSNRFEFESFGYGIDVSGNTAIVGTYDIRWIGKQMWKGRDSIPGGRAYILERNAEGAWVEKQILTSPDKHYEDRFGEMGVAIDGNVAVVSASHHIYGLQPSDGKVKRGGAAYIFEKGSNGEWEFKQKIVGSDRNVKGQFGLSVEVQGDYVFVGATNNCKDSYGKNYVKRAGAVFVYKRNAYGTWSQFQKLTAKNRSAQAHFGFALSVSGDYLSIGAYNETVVNGNSSIPKAGAVYMFKKNAQGVWVENQRIVPQKSSTVGSFGGDVDVKDNLLIIGAPSEPSWSDAGDSLKQTGSAYIYELSSYGTWDFKQQIFACDRQEYDNFGLSVGITKDCILVGIPYDEVMRDGKEIPNAGSAQFFKKENGKWVRTQRVTSHDPKPGQRFSHYLFLEEEFAGICEHLEGARPVNTVAKNRTGVVYFYGEFPDEISCDPIPYELIDYQHPNPPPPDVFTPEPVDTTTIITETTPVPPIVETEEVNGEAPKFTFTPNPSTGRIQLNILNYDGGMYEILIRIPMVRQVYKKKTSAKITDIDLSREKDGMYLIVVRNKYGASEQALMIKKRKETDDGRNNNGGGR